MELELSVALTELQLSLSNPATGRGTAGGMYQAPDRYKRLISARLPGGESAGLAASEDESETSPLRDGQLISRAHLAPFFAAANIVAALMMTANLWAAVAPQWTLPWVVAVTVVNLGAMQLARTQSITCVGRSGRRVPMWAMVGEVACRAVVWLSLPLYLFPSLDPATQVIAASVMAGLGVGSPGRVGIPAGASAGRSGVAAGVEATLPGWPAPIRGRGPDASSRPMTPVTAPTSCAGSRRSAVLAKNDRSPRWKRSIAVPKTRSSS